MKSETAGVATDLLPSPTLPTSRGRGRRVDLEGVLIAQDDCHLILNGALLSEVLAYHLPHKGKGRRKFGRVRVTVERIDE